MKALDFFLQRARRNLEEIDRTALSVPDQMRIQDASQLAVLPRKISCNSVTEERLIKMLRVDNIEDKSYTYRRVGSIAIDRHAKSEAEGLRW